MDDIADGRAPSGERRGGCPGAVRWGRWIGWLGVGLVGIGISVWCLIPWVPLPRGMQERVRRRAGLELLDRHGTTLRVVPGDDGQVARELTESDIPPAIRDATLAAEDARFFQHGGVDFRATVRAAAQWVRNGRVISGASTITQQLVKLAEPRPRTLRTKLIEAVQAWRLEREWDKPALLRAYLAQIDYGNGCAGLAEAARHYFGKRPLDLDLAESAFLAGLPQAPGRLNPRRRFDRAKARQEWVLKRCRQLGWITAAAELQAVAEPLKLVPARREFAAPHFVEQVLAGRKYAPEVFSTPQLRTTLDLPLQQRCEATVRRQLSGLEASRVGDAAVVVLDNRTGDVLALVGSGDWGQSEHGQVNGALARRSPGSALKPFTYLLAFADGASAAQVVADVPTEFATTTGVFQPVNYDRHCRGPVTLREALGNSLNLPAVRVLANHGGPARLQGLLQSFGLTTLTARPDEYGLGLTLGSGEVRLLELANAYATLARLGEWLPVRMIDRAAVPVRRRVAAADVCWLVADILNDPQARAVSFGLESPLRFDFAVACKTGTSSDFRDNWAFGFTPEFTVGVWVGNFDGTPMAGVSGVVGAAPILHEVMVDLHERHGTTWYQPPSGCELVVIDPLTGHRLGQGKAGRAEVLLPGAVMAEATAEDYDPLGRVRLTAEYAAWAASADNRWGDRIVVNSDTGVVRATGAPQILTPLPGTIFYLDADVPTAAQRLTLRASVTCHWECESLRLEEREGRTEVSLALGRHRLVATAYGNGKSSETWVEVRRL